MYYLTSTGVGSWARIIIGLGRRPDVDIYMRWPCWGVVAGPRRMSRTLSLIEMFSGQRQMKIAHPWGWQTIYWAIFCEQGVSYKLQLSCKQKTKIDYGEVKNTLNLVRFWDHRCILSQKLALRERDDIIDGVS
jgi:hypothetical protein